MTQNKSVFQSSLRTNCYIHGCLAVVIQILKAMRGQPVDNAACIFSSFECSGMNRQMISKENLLEASQHKAAKPRNFPVQEDKCIIKFGSSSFLLCFLLRKIKKKLTAMQNICYYWQSLVIMRGRKQMCSKQNKNNSPCVNGITERTVGKGSVVLSQPESYSQNRWYPTPSNLQKDTVKASFDMVGDHLF